eukprot:2888152-Rhodomonas_salina.2
MSPTSLNSVLWRASSSIPPISLNATTPNLELTLQEPLRPIMASRCFSKAGFGVLFVKESAT